MIKRTLKKIIPKWKPKVQIVRQKNWMGNTYGGFYVCPEEISESSIVYSFGIGTDISFDSSVIQKFLCTVYAFDPTPKSIMWMSENIIDGIEFYPYGIYIQDGQFPLYLPKNRDHVSGSIKQIKNVGYETVEVPMKRFSTILSELMHDSIDVLKLDIEGVEYEVFKDILTEEIPIKQIAVEFHHRFLKEGKQKTQEAISLLNEYGYYIFGVSDTGEEVSFIKLS